MMGRQYQACLRVIKNYIQNGRSSRCLNLQLIFNLDTIIKEGIPFTPDEEANVPQDGNSGFQRGIIKWGREKESCRGREFTDVKDFLEFLYLRVFLSLPRGGGEKYIIMTSSLELPNFHCAFRTSQWIYTQI